MSAPNPRPKRVSKRMVAIVVAGVAAFAVGAWTGFLPQAMDFVWTFPGTH